MTATTLLDRLDGVHDRGARLSLARAWPRGTDRLSLEYERPDGSRLAGQWFADPARAHRVADDTPGAHSCAPGVVLQPDGADRRLAELARLTGAPGAELMVHRPEQRGVVRRPGGIYSKIVPPDRLSGLLAADRLARQTGAVATADLIGVDHFAGRLDWAGAPGRSLHELLADPDIEVDRLREAGWAIGHAVRALHDSDVPAGVVKHHTVDDEIEAAERWLRAARRYARVPTQASELLEHARRQLTGTAVEPVLVHRDLHDKQLLVDGTSIVVLDLDTMALGEAALDLANLLVHLELRVLQGVQLDRANEVARAFLGAYGPDQATLARIDAYGDATRARLAGVYAFRPHEHDARTISITRSRRRSWPGDGADVRWAGCGCGCE